MRKSILYYLLLGVVFSHCIGQNRTSNTTLYNEDFKWRITLPDNFENVSPEDWAKHQNRGLEAIEDTYNAEVTNEAKIIFVFKNQDFNYLESNYQPFDESVDGDYLESCKNVNEILYETFKTQMPGIEIDSAASVQKISGLDFQTFKMKLDYPNGVTLHLLTHSRLFGEKEFSLNITYVDEILGRQMIDARTNSTFE